MADIVTYVRMLPGGIPEVDDVGALKFKKSSRKTDDAIAKHDDGTPMLMELVDLPNDYDPNEEQLTEYEWKTINGKLERKRNKRPLTAKEKQAMKDRDPFTKIAELEAIVIQQNDLLTRMLIALRQHEDPTNPATVVKTEDLYIGTEPIT